jgi:hypothetical protein
MLNAVSFLLPPYWRTWCQVVSALENDRCPSLSHWKRLENGQTIPLILLVATLHQSVLHLYALSVFFSLLYVLILVPESFGEQGEWFDHSKIGHCLKQAAAAAAVIVTDVVVVRGRCND